MQATLERVDAGLAVVFGDQRLEVDRALGHRLPELERYVGRPVILGIRPEDFDDPTLESDGASDSRIVTTCAYTEPLGAEVLVYFDVAARAIVAGVAEDSDPALGAEGPLTGPDRARLCARIDPKTKIREGSKIELAVDTTRLYFFDPDTRLAV